MVTLSRKSKRVDSENGEVHIQWHHHYYGHEKSYYLFALLKWYVTNLTSLVTITL